MKNMWERVQGELVRGVEEKWRMFEETVLVVGLEVCGTKRIREGRRRKRK